MATLFLINQSSLTSKKLFVEYYLPEYQTLFEKMRRGPYSLKSLGEISKRIFDGPFGSNRKVDMYQDSGIPYIRVKDVLPEGIVEEGLTYISPEKHKDLYRSKVIPGNVLITIAGRLGTAAVFPEHLVEGNITGHIVGLELPDTVNPYYIATTINSSLGQFQVERWGHRTTRPELNIQEIREIELPLPPRAIQDRIAAVMLDAYAQERDRVAAAKELLGSTEEYVFNVLKINPASVKETNRFMKSLSDIKKDQYRFDVAFNMGFHKFDPYTGGIELVGKVATFPKETINPESKPETEFQYIDIASIDVATGEISNTQAILGAHAPSRARQVVHTDDIIVSTVRPTRGAIAVIPAKMDGFICSTGFAVIRPRAYILAEYLHIALRLSTTLEQLARRSAGTSYPAVLENDIRATLIPVPEKQTQASIAAEVKRRYTKAAQLHSEAENIVTEAKARIEKMILGEEIR